MPQNNRDFVQRPLWGLEKRSANKQPRTSCMFISPYLPQVSKVLWNFSLDIESPTTWLRKPGRKPARKPLTSFRRNKIENHAQNRLQNHSRKLGLNSPIAARTSALERASSNVTFSFFQEGAYAYWRYSWNATLSRPCKDRFDHGGSDDRE